MFKFLLIIALLLVIQPSKASEDFELRSFQNEHVGKVIFIAPKSWAAIERQHIKFGTTFYRLVSPATGAFALEIIVNDLKHIYGKCCR